MCRQSSSNCLTTRRNTVRHHQQHKHRYSPINHCLKSTSPRLRNGTYCQRARLKNQLAPSTKTTITWSRRRLKIHICSRHAHLLRKRTITISMNDQLRIALIIHHSTLAKPPVTLSKNRNNSRKQWTNNRHPRSTKSSPDSSSSSRCSTTSRCSWSSKFSRISRKLSGWRPRRHSLGNSWCHCSNLCRKHLLRKIILSKCWLIRNKTSCKELNSKSLRSKWNVFNNNKRRSYKLYKCRHKCSKSSSNKRSLSTIKHYLWNWQARIKSNLGKNRQSSLCNLYSREISKLYLKER